MRPGAIVVPETRTWFLGLGRGCVLDCRYQWQATRHSTTRPGRSWMFDPKFRLAAVYRAHSVNEPRDPEETNLLLDSDLDGSLS